MLIIFKQMERTIASLDPNYYHFQPYKESFFKFKLKTQPSHWDIVTEPTIAMCHEVQKQFTVSY